MMIGNIQALRAMAALLVLVIHVMSTNKGLSETLNAATFEYWWIGNVGVDIFFVISGFIVSHAANKSCEKHGTGFKVAVVFMLRRIARIYPVYWIVLLFSFVFGGYLVLAPDWLPQAETWRLITLATTVNYKVMLAWTLAYEMLFYCILVAIIALPGNRFRYWLAGLATLHSTVIAGVALSGQDYWRSSILLSPMLLHFYAGCALFFLVRSRVEVNALLLLLLSFLFFLLGMIGNRLWGNWEPPARALFFAVPSALLVWSVIRMERTHDLILPMWLQRIGDSSYSLYIWHQFLLACLYAFFLRYGLFAALHWSLLLSIWAGLVICAGWVSYRVIEKPSMEWANAIISRIDLEVKK